MKTMHAFVVRFARKRQFQKFYLSALMMSAALVPSAFAQDTATQQEILDQLSELKALQTELNSRIQSLESQLVGDTPSEVAAIETPPEVETIPAPPVVAATETNNRFQPEFSGDLRLRYEGNFGGNDLSERHRGVVRARLAAQVEIDEGLSAHTRLATGDPDDPNSTDVTLSNFNDDLTVSLDRLYVQKDFDHGRVQAGKFPNPFRRTDLVWDGDVNFQGVGGQLRGSFGPFEQAAINGAVKLIDENAAGSDSNLYGLQLDLTSALSEELSASLAVGYYHYDLGTVRSANGGDFRSNRLTAAGDYVSDFQLVDVIATVNHENFLNWRPARLTLDYVENLGADDQQDGYSAFFTLPSNYETDRVGFEVGYAIVDQDAVFAAFSNDNLALATNYELYQLSTEFRLSPEQAVQLIYAYYREREGTVQLGSPQDDWLGRLRLNYVIGF